MVHVTKKVRKGTKKLLALHRARKAILSPKERDVFAADIKLGKRILGSKAVRTRMKRKIK